MSELRAFQRAFAGLLADPSVRPSDGALARAVTVHRNTLVKAALDALKDNYPVVRALVGADAFTAAALGYVRAQPPSDPRLWDYGSGFAPFLAAWRPFSGLSYLADVAALERAVLEALFSRDAEALSPRAILDGEVGLSTRLALHPATRLVRSAAPIGSLWAAHQAAPSPNLSALAWRGEVCLVARPALEVSVVVLEAAGEALVQGILAGETLGGAAARAAERGELSTALAALLSAGALVRAEAAQTPSKSAPGGADGPLA